MGSFCGENRIQGMKYLLRTSKIRNLVCVTPSHGFSSLKMQQNITTITATQANHSKASAAIKTNYFQMERSCTKLFIIISNILWWVQYYICCVSFCMFAWLDVCLRMPTCFSEMSHISHLSHSALVMTVIAICCDFHLFAWLEAFVTFLEWHSFCLILCKIQMH